MTDAQQTLPDGARVRPDSAERASDVPAGTVGSPVPPSSGARRERAYAPRSHPLRSLALSAAAHTLLAVVLALVPAPRSAPVGTESIATAWRRVSVSVAFAPEPVRWPEPVEPQREVELAELAPEEELLEEAEMQGLELPQSDWFDEDAPPPAQRAREFATSDVLADLPDDLFRAPEPPEVTEEMPAETESAEQEPAEESPPVDAEPTEDELPPDVVDSDAAPEREGEEEEAEQSGDGKYETALLDGPVPRYPPLAKRLRHQGTVVLEVRVDASGEVLSVHVRESSGHELLDEAARVCVLARWRFRPARSGEADLRRFYPIPITFRLRN